MAKKIFSLEDSRAFALLSGDANPIHVDALAARRLLYGRSLVHGIHSLLWGLDQHVGEARIKAVPAAITVTFSRPVFHGDAVTSSVTESKSPDEFRFSVLCRDADAAQVRLKAGTDTATHSNEWTPAPAIPLDDLTCVELSDDDMADKSGTFPLGLDVERLAKIFPALAATEWLGTVAMLLGLTRLVGMECPGLHSIFASLKMNCTGNGPASLRYGVKRWDARFQSLSLNVDAGRWSGTVGAIVRPSPVAQPSISEIKANVKLAGLEGRHALVIGGSRGLGEVAAKILAAAGSTATITYNRGKAEAEAVVKDIIANGGEARALAFDVTRPGENSLELASLPPITDIYYFASPKIIANMTETFDSALFEHYMDFFVRPLPAVLALLLDHLDEEFSFYWPSTSFIDKPEPGFQEYVNAKTDGEACCQMLAGNAPKARFSMPRLPRLRTDQTQSILPLALADPVQVLGASLLDHMTPLVQRAV